MAKTKEELVAQLTEIANLFEAKGNVDEKNRMLQIIDDLNTGKKDTTEVTVKAKIKLEKFNGDKLPDSVPVEVKEFITDV